jgi:uncharacterized protein (DUF1499 family)
MRFRFLTGKPSHIPGISAGNLAACPARPNCVCSDVNDSQHGISALILSAPPAQAWEAARSAVLALPRTQIVSASSDDYLHAECRSAVFGFVDDLELHLRPKSNSIAVRSASRLGYRDFEVNRKRVETLRAHLAALDVVKANAAL